MTRLSVSKRIPKAKPSGDNSSLCTDDGPKNHSETDDNLVSLTCHSSVAMFIVMLSVYVATMSRTVAGGDAAELASCACSLSVPHPPGYPLFILMYHYVWKCSIWLGVLSSDASPAIAFNALSAVLSAAAVAILHQTIREFGCSSVKATLVSIMFGFSSTVWLYASQSEVFALNNFLIALLMRGRCTPWAFEHPTLLRSSVSAFVAGLALSNQHTAILFIVPLALCLYISHWDSLFSIRTLIANVVAFCVGVLPYAYLPYASSQNRLRSWGDLTTWSGFLRHLLRQEYGTFQLQVDPNTSDDETIMYRLIVYIEHLVRETMGVICIAAVFGVYIVLTKWKNQSESKRPAAKALIICYALYMLTFLSLNRISLTPLNRGIQERFWMQPLAVASTFAGIGLSRVRSSIWVGLLALTSLTQFLYVLPTRNATSNASFERYGLAAIQDVPPNSIMLVHGDALFNALSYVQSCRGVRQDVNLIHVLLWNAKWFLSTQKSHFSSYVHFPGMFHRYSNRDPDAFTFKDFLDANIDHQDPSSVAVLLCMSASGLDFAPDQYKQGYRDWPAGYCRRLLPLDKRPLNMTSFLRSGWNQLNQLPPFNPRAFTDDTWEYHAHVNTWALQEKMMGTVVEAMGDNNEDINENLLRLAVQIADFISEEYQQNTGRMQMMPSFYREAARAYGFASVRWEDEMVEYEKKMHREYRWLLMRLPESAQYERKSISEILRNRSNPFR